MAQWGGTVAWRWAGGLIWAPGLAVVKVRGLGPRGEWSREWRRKGSGVFREVLRPQGSHGSGSSGGPGGSKGGESHTPRGEELLTTYPNDEGNLGPR